MSAPKDPNPDRGNEDKAAEGWFADGPLRRLLANTSLLVGGRSLNGVFNLAAMTLIVREVGIELFGLLALVHAVASTISDLVKFQSWQSVLRYGTPALDQNRIQDFVRLIRLTVLLDLSSAVFGVLVAVLSLPILGPHLGLPAEWIGAIQLYSISIFFMVTATPTGLLRLFDRFDLLSISNAIGSFIRVLGALWIVFYGANLETLLWIWFASTVASGCWLIGHSIRALSARGLLKGHHAGFRNLTAGHEGIVAFIWTTQANTTLAAGTRQMATVVVGFLLTPAAAGLYDVSRQLTTLLTRFAKLLKPAIYPEFARLSVRNDLTALKQLTLRSMALSAGAGALMVLPIVLFGRSILVFIFGPELEAAYGVTVLLALAAAVRLLAFPLEPALISTGRAGMALVVRAATVVVFLGALFALIPRIGLLGAGFAGIASALVSFGGQAFAVSVWFKSRTA